MNWLVDSNILVRMAHLEDSRHDVALNAVSFLYSRGEAVYIVPQNLYEFWAVVTRPTTSNGYGLSPEVAERESEKLKSQFKLRADTEAVFPNWDFLVRKFRVSGKETHDARLVAAMLAHDIRNILTFNVKDFKRYAGTIDAFDPQDVIDGRSVV